MLLIKIAMRMVLSRGFALILIFSEKFMKKELHPKIEHFERVV